ncbi:MAG: arylesterase [Alphaproteobacteria bacterium]|nr:MAG: arylesterase [Alphaproteobacteria bacterium]
MQKQQGLTSAYGGRTALFNIFAGLLLVFCILSNASAAPATRIVAIGDSLTAGYGLPPGVDFVTQLQAALRKENFDVKIENAGVSGDTSTGGLQRLDWALGDGADLVILELGANDALRGISPGVTRKNLDEILGVLKRRNIPVLLTGMMAPPNMGKDYASEFNSIYPDLAAKYDVELYPFFLKDVAAIPSLNQSDAIHPNAEGVKVIVKNMLPYVARFLK